MSQTTKDNLYIEYLAWQQRRLKDAIVYFKNSNQDQFGLLRDLFLYNWLQREVKPPHKKAVLALAFPKLSEELTNLMLTTWDNSKYLQGLIAYWHSQKSSLQRKESIENLLAKHGGDISLAVDDILATWQKLALFKQPHKEAFREILEKQKKRGAEVGGDIDKERAAIIDRLPDSFNWDSEFQKVGIIPHMGCAKNCRHCMFVWRQPIKNKVDAKLLFKPINSATKSVLFTGGDLDRHMPEFYRAIASMETVSVFAILLNGAFATTLSETEARFLEINKALEKRKKNFQLAKVILQISFDEYHQEILSDEKGELKERISVVNIANIVTTSLKYPQIQLVLLHKQNRLNFSENLIKVGLFDRLNKTLTAMGYPVVNIDWHTSPRKKADPANPTHKGGVIRDVIFSLQGFSDQPIHMMSSTIDAYGRAALLDPSEYINERDYLDYILANGPPDSEQFDIDPMVWYDGSVTLFSAAHVWVGNIIEEEGVFARYKKDPLLHALRQFDKSLLGYYAEADNDLETLIKSATGPHHLFHLLTQSAAMRLHMTKRLVENRNL
ncbi:MAG: hypothetical protein HQL71_01120 [Magnetococcales bacterium]|nr:hypothetical protein [Magnetococcales bacterium]